MTKTITTKNNIEALISNEILNHSENFTIEDIVNEVKNKFEELIKAVEDLQSLITEKIQIMCNVGLVTYNGLYYYVN